MTRSHWGRVVLALTAILVFVLDQATKYVIVQSVPLNTSWNPLPGLSYIVVATHVVNTGAAFGLFPDQGTLFIVIAVVVVVAIVSYYRYLPADRLLIRASLGLQLGGALGNLVDRVHYGYVVDWIDFKVWPVFNVADAAIVTGVAILAYFLLQEPAAAPMPEKPESVGGEGAAGA